MHKILLAAMAVVFALGPASAAELPFIGKWDCGVGTFSFTAKNL